VNLNIFRQSNTVTPKKRPPPFVGENLLNLIFFLNCLN